MNEGGAREQSRRRRRRWIIIVSAIVLLFFGAGVTYSWIKARRAERFAAAGDAFVAADKWSEAAVQYRVALQLNPSSYRGLSGAARLATKADRPEALELWQKVLTLSECTNRDRQDYADLLIKTNRLNLAEKVINPLLQNNPDTKTLQLAARYSKKIGNDSKAIEYARIASKRAPEDDTARFQLADFLAKSTDASEQTEARNILWDLAAKPGAFKKAALEALAIAPQLTTDERNRLLQELTAITPKNVKDDLLAADLNFQLHPDDAARIYREEIDRWGNGQTQELVDLTR